MSQTIDDTAAEVKRQILELLREAQENIAAAVCPANTGQSTFIDMGAAKVRIDAAKQKIRAANELIKNIAGRCRRVIEKNRNN